MSAVAAYLFLSPVGQQNPAFGSIFDGFSDSWGAQEPCRAGCFRAAWQDQPSPSSERQEAKAKEHRFVSLLATSPYLLFQPFAVTMVYQEI